MPTVKIAAPTREQVISADKAGAFEVKLDVKNWQTATGSSHVHLILDNKPYKPIYDTKAGVKLSDLMAVAKRSRKVIHVLVAFPSRASHESVKGERHPLRHPVLDRQEGRGRGCQERPDEEADADLQPPEG